jgi:hypothetical protein
VGRRAKRCAIHFADIAGVLDRFAAHLARRTSAATPAPTPICCVAVSSRHYVMPGSWLTPMRCSPTASPAPAAPALAPPVELPPLSPAPPLAPPLGAPAVAPHRPLHRCLRVPPPPRCRRQQCSAGPALPPAVCVRLSSSCGSSPKQDAAAHASSAKSPTQFWKPL